MKPLDVDNLVRDYLVGKSIKQLAEEQVMCTDTIKAVLRSRNVQFRTRSETAKLFNRGPTREKVTVSEEAADFIISEYLAGRAPARIGGLFGLTAAIVYRELAKAGVLRDVSQAQLLRWQQASPAEREALVGPCHRANTGRKQKPENLLRAAATRQRRLVFNSPSETALREALRGLGYTIEPQRAVGPYNLDAGLEECRVAVEIQTGHAGAFLYSARGQKRLKHLFDDGWSVLFVCFRACGWHFPDVVQKVLAFCEVAGRDKPCFRQYGVIRSDGQTYSGRCPNPDGLTRVPGF